MTLRPSERAYSPGKTPGQEMQEFFDSAKRLLEKSRANSSFATILIARQFRKEIQYILNRGEKIENGELVAFDDQLETLWETILTKMNGAIYFGIPDDNEELNRYLEMQLQKAIEEKDPDALLRGMNILINRKGLVDEKIRGLKNQGLKTVSTELDVQDTIIGKAFDDPDVTSV